MNVATTLLNWVMAKLWRLIAAFALVVVVIFALNRLLSWGGCELYGHQTERDVRYAAFVGCLVHVNDAWVPKNELRIVQ